MKRIIKPSTIAAHCLLLLSAVAGFGIACSSCTTMEPTSLDESTISTKSIICGHVRIVALDKNGVSEKPYPADPGLTVNIFYGIPEGGSVKAYAVKTVTTDADGYFETTLGCPAGQALRVKVEAGAKAESFAMNESGKYVATDAYFFCSLEKAAECGKATYYAIDMTPTANISEGGLRNI